MKRILLVLTIAAVMAAMVALVAVPAFALEVPISCSAIEGSGGNSSGHSVVAPDPWNGKSVEPEQAVEPDVQTGANFGVGDYCYLEPGGV